MVRRALMLVLASGSIAHAQAPAQEPAPPPPGPSPDQPLPLTAPPAAAPAAAPAPPAAQVQAPAMMPPPPPPRTVMSKRWAIGLDVGPEQLQSENSGKVEFGQFELAGRYRLRRSIELGLALHLGGSKDIGEG